MRPRPEVEAMGLLGHDILVVEESRDRREETVWALRDQHLANPIAEARARDYLAGRGVFAARDPDRPPYWS